MTVETTTAKTGPLACNGSADEFAFDFPILEAAHLVVTLTDSDDTETVLTLNTHYTVEVSGYPGTGQIVTSTVYASGYTITMHRATEQTQETDLVNSGPYHAQTQEDALDKLTMMIQDMAERLSRAILVAVSSEDAVPDYAGALAALQAAITAAEEVVAVGAVPTSRTISTTSPLTGGGDLSANRTFALANSGVTANTYAFPSSITVTAKGLISSITAGAGGVSLGWFNVKDYGAVGNGVADDTTAVQAAITALVAAGGGVLYFPKGTYLVTAKLNIAGVSAYVMGDGINLSVVVWDVAAGGIDFTSNYPGSGSSTLNVDVLAVKGLTLTTMRVGGGSAIKATFVASGVNADRQLFLTDVAIHGFDHSGTHTDYWTKGVELVDAFGASLTNVYIAGTHSASHTSSSAYGIHYTTTGGVALNLMMDNVVCHLYYTGLYILARLEAVHIINSEFAENYYSLDLKGVASGGVSNVNIASTHLGGSINCLRGRSHSSLANGVGNIHISNCLMLRASNPAGGQYLDGSIIDIEDSFDGTITGCAFLGSKGDANEADNENGIVIGGDSGNYTISGNVFRNIADTAIFTAVGAHDIRVGTNAYYECGAEFFTNGEKCVREGVYRGILLNKTANQSINTATLTAITWAAATHSTESGVTTDPIWAAGAVLTVPEGVTKVRLRASCGFASAGGTWATAITFRKNSAYTYTGRPAVSAFNDAGGLLLAIQSATLSVTAGDTFELMAEQQSGGALNILHDDAGGGKTTWMEMEIVA